MPSSRPRRSASSRSCRRVSDLPGVAARRIRRAALRGALVAFGAAVLVVVVALATDRTKMLPWSGLGLFAGTMLVSQSSDRAWSEVAKLASEFQRRPGRAALLALAIAAPLGLSAWSRIAGHPLAAQVGLGLAGALLAAGLLVASQAKAV